MPTWWHESLYKLSQFVDRCVLLLIWFLALFYRASSKIITDCLLSDLGLLSCKFGVRNGYDILKFILVLSRRSNWSPYHFYEATRPMYAYINECLRLCKWTAHIATYVSRFLSRKSGYSLKVTCATSQYHQWQRNYNRQTHYRWQQSSDTIVDVSAFHLVRYLRFINRHPPTHTELDSCINYIHDGLTQAQSYIYICLIVIGRIWCPDAYYNGVLSWSLRSISGQAQTLLVLYGLLMNEFGLIQRNSRMYTVDTSTNEISRPSSTTTETSTYVIGITLAYYWAR